jgi:hypothetical protein
VEKQALLGGVPGVYRFWRDWNAGGSNFLGDSFGAAVCWSATNPRNAGLIIDSGFMSVTVPTAPNVAVKLLISD